jgi:hypothetical protein
MIDDVANLLVGNVIAIAPYVTTQEPQARRVQGMSSLPAIR